MVKLAIAVSGRGSNLKALAAGMASDCRFAPPIVVADKPCPALEWAEKQGLRTLLLPYRQSKEAAESALTRLLDNEQIDGLLLAGFMRLLSPAFVERYKERILNIHPSLLPKFKGAQALKDFWESDEKESGVSIHLVTAELDGGPLLAQEKVSRSNSFETFEEAIHAVEHQLYWPVAQAYFTR